MLRGILLHETAMPGGREVAVVFAGSCENGGGMTVAFETFKAKAAEKGLAAVDHGRGHWQIRGGYLLVNFYPRTGTIFINGMVNGKKSGSVGQAIQSALTPPGLTNHKARRLEPKASRALKIKIWMNKQKCCRWCGKALGIKEATLEHVIPLARGGSNQQDNLTIACRPCNAARGPDMPEIERATRLEPVASLEAVK